MMARLWIIVAGSALAQGLALRHSMAGKPESWLVLGIAYAVLGGLALRGLWDRQTLGERLRPKFGDITIGASVGGVLLLGSWAGRSLLAPLGSPGHAWLSRIELAVGDPNAIQRSLPITLTLLSIAALDEIVWRGYVLDSLGERFGDRRAFIYSILLYGAAALPTVVTLNDSFAGPNPLWTLLALGCGLFWTFLARVTGRLPPVIIAHWVFAYFSAVQFRFAAMLPLTGP
jgi:membrane protease YdiL (CAAX protease family)